MCFHTLLVTASPVFDPQNVLVTPGGRVRLYYTFKGAFSFSFFLSLFSFGGGASGPGGVGREAAWQTGATRLLRGLVANPPQCFTGCKLAPTPICITQVLIVGVCGVFPPGLGE